jgi:hypothetical protein
MASTAKPPDPMPCALAAVLLPESLAHGCHMQKTLFPGPVPRASGAYVLGPCLRAGFANAAWAVGGSRSDVLGAGTRCLAPRVGGGRWSSAARGGAGLGGRRQRVGEWWSGRRSVFPQCGVGHAWTLGLVTL